MPETQKQWIKDLRRKGYAKERGGNHQVKMTMRGGRPITLPHNKGRVYARGFEAALRRELQENETLADTREREAVKDPD